MLPNRGIGWRYDLPAHDAPPTQREVFLSSVLKTNVTGRIFIELPRSSTSARGIALLGGLIFLTYAMVCIAPDILDSLFHYPQSRLDITVIGAAIVLLSTWAFFFHSFVWT